MEMRKDALNKAFSRACEATVELDRARHLIAELHYKIEELENSRFLLENVGKWAAPDDDAHEILFERVHKAEEALDKSIKGGDLNGIIACLERASYEVTASVEAARKVKEDGPRQLPLTGDEVL